MKWLLIKFGKSYMNSSYRIFDHVYNQVNSEAIEEARSKSRHVISSKVWDTVWGQISQKVWVEFYENH